jgi:hypothetical protein
MSLNSDIVVSVALIRVYHVLQNSLLYRASFLCMLLLPTVPFKVHSPASPIRASRSAVVTPRSLFRNNPANALQLYTRAPSRVQVYNCQRTTHFQSSTCN